MKTMGDKLGNRFLMPQDVLYEEKRKVWNAAINRYPSAIAVCGSEEDVVSAVRLAAERGLAVSIRGGGHHVAGTAVCDDGLMIDLSEMRQVKVDEIRRIAFVQGGATLADIDLETQKYGLATPLGTVSKTGVAGLALNGGLGYLRRKHGLTCDNIIGARIVTADGELLHVHEKSYPDLFWAIKGGGGNFGVVTEFELQLYPIGQEVLALDVMYRYEDVHEVLLKAQEFNQTAPDGISFNMTITQLPPAPFLPEFLHHQKVIIITGMYVGEPGEPMKGMKVIRPLRELALPIMDHTGVTTYNQLQQKLDPMVPETAQVVGTSLFFDELNENVLEILLNKIENAPSPTMIAQLWPLGGEMNRVEADATAFAIRDAGVVLLLDMMVDASVDMESCKKWVDSVYADLLPYSHKQSSYLNGIGLSEMVTKNAFADNYQRLLEIKRKYDPANMFRFNHNINPFL